MKTAFSLLVAAAIAIVSVHADRCDSKDNGVTFPNTDSCETYVLCFNQMEISLECPAGHWFDIKSSSCLPEAEAKCYMLSQGPQCPDSGLSAIPHPDSCERYFICYDGEMIERSCFNGLHWNAEAEQCMDPRLAGCIAQEEHKCPLVSNPGEVTFIPNPNSCTRFYVCFNGQPMERECATGLHWEQSLSKCVPAEQSTCRIPGNTDIEQEVVDENVEDVINMDDFCKGIVFDILPYPESRRRYIVCIAGKATDRQCRRGMRFNKNLRACVPVGKQWA